jgi:hypothetical protein
MREGGEQVSEQLLDQGWCVEHYAYYYKDEGCEVCRCEEESA